MSTCKDCKYFIQEERHRGRCEKHPYVRTRKGMVEMLGDEPRKLYVYWGRNACKTFEMKDDTEENNCKHCIHYEACSKWTDFPKQCGIPVCSRFSNVVPKTEVAMEIFEEIEEDVVDFPVNDCDIQIILDKGRYDNIKKKYTEEDYE